MGVTNGFLKLRQDEFQQLRNHRNAFEERLRAVWGDDEEDYLDMDKAGYELLFLMIDSNSELSPQIRSLYPHILAVLGGDMALEEAVFPDLDMGYGPARIVDPSALRKSIQEFDTLNYDTVHALAMDSDVLDDEIKEDFGDYHWVYLQSL